jgi:hypothetical protein
MEKGLKEAQINKCSYLEDIYHSPYLSSVFHVFFFTLNQQDLLNIIKAIAMCILKRPQQFDKLFLLHKFYCSQSSFTHKPCVITWCSLMNIAMTVSLLKFIFVSLLVTMCYYSIYFVTLVLTLWRSLSLLDVL